MNEEVSVKVVNRIASRLDADPAELTPPLYAAIDPTALDTLVEGRTDTSSVTVEFSYQGFRVTVDGDGHVSLSDDATDTTDTSTVDTHATGR